MAWADGEVQEQERETILQIAREKYQLGDEGAVMLTNWLTHPPSDAYLERGRRLLVALAHEREGFDLSPGQLGDVVAFCRQVAEAAGGFLGFRTVSGEEADAIEAIARALSISGDRAFSLDDFDEDLEDEPTDIVEMGDVTPVSQPRVQGADGPTSGPLFGRLELDLDGNHRRFDIGEDGLTIGRSRANSVRLMQDAQVSRVHARIRVTDGRVSVEDSGTTNGTWVNGERVEQRRLYGGETLRIGCIEFQYRGT